MLLISLILFLTFPGFLVLVSQLNLKKQIFGYWGFSCHLKTRLETLKYFQTSLHPAFFAFGMKKDCLTKFLTGRVKKLNIYNDLFSDGQIFEMPQTSRRPS